LRELSQVLLRDKKIRDVSLKWMIYINFYIDIFQIIKKYGGSKMKKNILFILVAVMLLTPLIGCGNSSATDSTVAATSVSSEKTADEPKTEEVKDVTVKFLNGKVEIADALKKMIPDFEKENPGIKLNIESIGGGADYGAACMAKFQSGEAPDIFFCSGFADLTKWSEKVEDLSDQPWVKDMIEGASVPISKDGKIYGFPLAVEGFGFAYNKTLFAKAGITTLPNTLTTLEDACKKLKASGIQPFSNSYAEWWALGMHNFNVPLAHQDDSQKFINDVAAGTAKLKDNPVSAGWVKLLDLTVKYGQKNSTTAGDYATSVNVFAAGKAAMIQQGNWIQPDLDKVDENLDVGFIPMPISETPDEKINAGVPNFLVIHNASKVVSQAKTFLNWFESSETGKRYITEELKALPAFKTITSQSFKGLNASLIEYTSTGKTYPWVFPRLPSGSSELIGAAMMKYLANQSDSTTLLNTIDKAIVDKAKTTAK
jgi:raffinose/stachyose/melibiose transport system substrate-binding protein